MASFVLGAASCREALFKSVYKGLCRKALEDFGELPSTGSESELVEDSRAEPVAPAQKQVWSGQCVTA
jgi:hypothetical protein